MKMTISGIFCTKPQSWNWSWEIKVYLTTTPGILHGRKEGPGSGKGIEPRRRVEVRHFLVSISVTAEHVDTLVNSDSQWPDALILRFKVFDFQKRILEINMFLN